MEKRPTQSFKLWWVRKVVQTISTIVLLGAGLGISRTAMTLPILLTLGASEKTAVSAFDAIQEMFAEPMIPWIPLAVFMVFGILVGRATCAWVCPFGFLQDLMATVNSNRHEVSPRTHEGAIKVKYGILGMTLFFSGSLGLSLIYGVGKDYKNALGVLAQGPFSALSPEATLLGVVPVITRMIILYFLGIPPVASPFNLDTVWGKLSSVSWLLAIRLMIFVSVVALSFFFLRAFCRYLCPAGALLAIFSRSSLLGLKRNPLQCDKCGNCVKVCPMLVRIMDRPWEKMTDPECIMCLECTDACGSKAIKPTFP